MPHPLGQLLFGPSAPSRRACGYPYYLLLAYLIISITQPLLHEGIGRGGIKTALGVPCQTSTVKVCAATSTLHIIEIVTNCLLGQLIRLHGTAPGRLILEKLATRASARQQLI